MTVGKDTTSLYLNNWWVGARYVELLKQSNSTDAAIAEAQAELKANPKDDAAKIKLAYALRAQGNQADSEAKLREIPWTAWPDRPFKKPSVSPSSPESESKKCFDRCSKTVSWPYVGLA